jgi:myosin heavy subunit
MSLPDISEWPSQWDSELKLASESFALPKLPAGRHSEPATQQQIEGLQQWLVASVDELLQQYATKHRTGEHVVADLIRQMDQKLARVDGSVKKLQEDLRVQECCLDHVTQRVDELKSSERNITRSSDVRERLGLSIAEADAEENNVMNRYLDLSESRLRSVELSIEDRDMVIQNTEKRLDLTDARLASFESSCRDLQTSGASAGRDSALAVVHQIEENFQKDIQDVHARCDALRELVNESVVMQVQSLEQKVIDHSAKVDQLLSRLGDQVRSFQVWSAVQAALEKELAQTNTKIEQLFRRDEAWDKSFKEVADDVASLRKHFNGDALIKFRANWNAPQRPC